MSEDTRRGARGRRDAGAAAAREEPSIEDLEEAMRDVVDPELGINVVDLGLVYGIRVDERRRRRHRHDAHQRGLPAHRRDRGPGAGRARRQPVGGLVDDIRINWVWMPPWGPEKITEEGREQLRALGFRRSCAETVPETSSAHDRSSTHGCRWR